MSEGSDPVVVTPELAARVAKLEEEMKISTPSPTGTPLIPPKAFAIIALVVGIALAVLGALVGLYPEQHGFAVALAVTTAVAGVLGIASPGLRKQVVVLLCAGALFAGTGCVHFNKPKLTSGLQQCAAGFVESEVAGVMPDVIKAIQSQKADWQSQLDAVILRGGTAAICALTVLMSSLESGTGGTGGAMPVLLAPPESGGISRAAVLLRAYSYIDSRQ